MADEENDHDQFAASLLALTLIRNGYLTQKEVRVGRGRTADLLVSKEMQDGSVDRFAVELKWVSSPTQVQQIGEDLLAQRKALSALLGIPVYGAFVIGDGSEVQVDAELESRMLYSPEDMRVLTLQPT
ncbi:hypothetical protein [Massilia sp. KIM]|uniref:hypothetical protein n=1 Tax=Massilia sp. KIM TaxID=1955422 RepID=UPI00117FBD94|nr:hypothetical protein [Massilia sp. KIM]